VVLGIPVQLKELSPAGEQEKEGEGKMVFGAWRKKSSLDRFRNERKRGERPILDLEGLYLRGRGG